MMADIKTAPIMHKPTLKSFVCSTNGYLAGIVTLALVLRVVS